MTINIEIKDRNGKSIELGQRIAIKVFRRSGNYSNWWQRKNKNHFIPFWIPAVFVFERHELYLRPDAESEKALEQPMGKEQGAQCVDHINIDFNNPENFDSVNIPDSGTYTIAK